MDCPTLLDLLFNSIVLQQTCPYLSISGLLSLASTSRSFRALIFSDSGTFRHLDLSTAKGAQVDLAPIDRGGINWRSQRIDESTTEDDFYGGPLRGIFSYLKRTKVLANVHTLILDGASAPAEILREIICEEPYQVKILSVIGSTNLNERKFQQALRYAVRPTRPTGTKTQRRLRFWHELPTFAGESYDISLHWRYRFARCTARSVSQPKVS